MAVPLRVGAALNRALHGLLAANPRQFVLGEDIADPYGGAFGITRGLSTRYPERVISTPISEAAIVGAAGGLALCGDPVLVEIMFGDFITLCVDPLINFISKSVSMYGRRLPMPVVVRCPVGGNRGYGPTHSQSPQKILFGQPNLSLFELSPVHDSAALLSRIFAAAEPAVLFEDKVLYTTPQYAQGTADGVIDGIFRFAALDENWTLVSAEETAADCLLIVPGGVVPRALPALCAALVEAEVVGQLLVPSRLFPIELGPVLPHLAAARRILIAEDGVAGGGWAAELARRLYEQMWGRLRGPVGILQPSCAVIPAAPHLEREMLLQESTIYRAVAGGARA